MLRTATYPRLPRSRFLPPAALAIALACLAAPGAARAQCDDEPPIQNYTGAGEVVCPCFVPGEEAGSIFTAPAGHYPIEILRVGVGWGSQLGGAPQSLEGAINVYGAGLPNPGAPIASLPGPVLTDGFINEFDLEPLVGEIIRNSGPFTVTLEFLNQNNNNQFAPSVVHDGNGCQAGKNVIYATPPGAWFNACALGVTGDWVFFVVYRKVDCTTSVDEHVLVSSSSAVLGAPQPNPFRESTQIDFVLPRESEVSLSVVDVSGRVVATLARSTFSAGASSVRWDGRDDAGSLVAAGTYLLRLEAGSDTRTGRVVLVR